MKKSILHSLMSLFVGMLILSFSACNEKEVNNSSAEQEEFIKERIRWEKMRIMDPATGEIPRNARQNAISFVSNLPGSYNSLLSMKEKAPSIQSADWKRRGPYYVGGRTRALALDTRNEDIILAGGVSGGMWKSTDAGQSWTKTFRPDQIQSVTCIAQDTREGKEDNWYIGSGEFWGNSSRIDGGGIYKSIDNGSSWEVLESTANNEPQSNSEKFDYAWNIVVDHTAPINEDHVYVSTAFGGIYKSIDGGENWNLVLGGSNYSSSFFTDIQISPSGVLYATLSQATFNDGNSNTSGIFRSEDGDNWVNISPADMPEKFERIVIAIAPSDENQIYFLGETTGAGKLTTNSYKDSLWHSVWKYNYLSGDGSGDGGTWENRSQAIPKPELVRWQMNSQTSYDLVCEVKPDDPNFVVFGGVNLYRTTDGFQTEESVDLIGGTCPDPNDECVYHYRWPNHHADQHAVLFLPSDNNIMFTGSDGGVHKTIDIKKDRIEWISLNEGYYTTQFYSIAIDKDSDSKKVAGGLQDNGTLFSPSEVVETEWTIPSNGDGLTTLIDEGGDIVYSSQNAGTRPVKVMMYKSILDDDGKSLIKKRIDPAGGLDFPWNHPMVLDPNDNNKMYIGGGKILWRNNDLSEIPMQTDKDSTSVNWDSLSNTRCDLGSEIANKPADITAVAVSKTPANVVYYGTSMGEMFRLDDAHLENPTPVNITSDDFPYATDKTRGSFINNVLIDPDDANKVFAVFSSYNVQSVFYSEDAGNTWTAVTGNLEENENGAGNGPACYWMDVLKFQDKKIYFLGTSAGLYSTLNIDGMSTEWKQESADLIGNTVIRGVNTRDRDAWVVVGTHGAGVIEGTVTSLPDLPAAVTLNLPADNSEYEVRSEHEFSWHPSENASYYEIQVASDESFNDIIMTMNGIEDTTATLKQIPQGAVELYWRVIAKSWAGQNLDSESRKFKTMIAAPELVFPANDQEDMETSFEFTWNDAKEADKYHLQVARNFTFSKIILDTILDAKSCLIAELEYDKKHYWRVSSINDAGESDFGEAYLFRTKKSNSIFSYYELSDMIKNVYPNPVTNSSNVEYEIKDAGSYSMILTDITGNQIVIFEYTYLLAGEFDQKINKNNLPAGIYILSLVSDNTISRRKIVIK